MKLFDKCPICGGELVEREVEKLPKGGVHAVVLKIRADVCLQCDERLYSAETVKRFEQIRQKLERQERINMMTEITPHLWFDKEARESAEFYCSVFPNASIRYMATLRNTPSGDCEVVAFTLAGQPFIAISAGPLFRFNPSVSFFVNFDPSRDAQSQEHLDALWAALSDGGQVLMPLDEYPFSKRYGWVQDRYGLSWQLILSNPDGEPRPIIVPCLLFTGKVCGKAEEAGAFYRSVFPDSQLGQLVRYPAGTEPNREGTVMFSDFRLGKTWISAMDSAFDHGFGFNEAISLMIDCDTQEEIDYYWERLSAVPEAEACGWCKDRYGLSWQISPRLMHEIMTCGDQAKIDRVTHALLTMKKFDIATLERTYKLT